MVRLNERQVAVLAKYEDNLKRAYYSDWVRNMTSRAVDEIAEVLNEVGIQTDANASCGACILNLCRDAGRIYFSQEKPEKPEKPEVKPAPKPKKPAPKSRRK